MSLHEPTAPPARRYSPSALLTIFAAWFVLQIGGLFSPGLLDDVDSIYIQIAREMLHRHDFVTPTIDGIRFFDKPPLMYWLSAACMRVFGIHDWAARLPLALGMLALLIAVYALGVRFYAHISPADAPDRGGLYAALALATSIGPYLYTRFYIPDMLVALWMTLSVHLFLTAVDRAASFEDAPGHRVRTEHSQSAALHPELATHTHRVLASSFTPMLGFAAVLALSVLTKGLIGAIFPVGFALLYLLFTRQLALLRRLHLLASSAVFLLIAAPWHVLAAMRNPPIVMPPGAGLPPYAGWTWFYLYNEHIARFLGRRIPHDYGQVPVLLFWLLLVIWLIPWAAFLPAAFIDAVRTLRAPANLRFDSDVHFSGAALVTDRTREAALTTLLWAGLVLGFFTLGSRQEYYHLPALPALALLAGGFLASADTALAKAALRALRGALYMLVPLGGLVFIICAYFAITAPHPAPGVDLNTALNSNPANYNLSLGHIFDLTGTAMGFFRGPLVATALGMLTLGPLAYLIRRRGRTLAANLVVAAGMTTVLLGAHEGLARFYPILGSKDLAFAINQVRQPADLILIDGELTAGSTLLFYTGQPVHLVNGRVNGPWFGSFWPDSPHVFDDDASLRQRWAGPQRLFLLTYHPDERTRDLSAVGPVHVVATSGGKTILSNR